MSKLSKYKQQIENLERLTEEKSNTLSQTAAAIKQLEHEISTIDKDIGTTRHNIAQLEEEHDYIRNDQQ